MEVIMKRDMSDFQSNGLELIKCFERRTVLWNAENPNRTNKLAKKQAWDEVGREMGMHGDVCRRKIANMLQYLKSEVEKIKKYKAYGKVYYPQWFAFKSFSFIYDKDLQIPSRVKRKNLKMKSPKIAISGLKAGNRVQYESVDNANEDNSSSQDNVFQEPSQSGISIGEDVMIKSDSNSSTANEIRRLYQNEEDEMIKHESNSSTANEIRRLYQNEEDEMIEHESNSSTANEIRRLYQNEEDEMIEHESNTSPPENAFHQTNCDGISIGEDEPVMVECEGNSSLLENGVREPNQSSLFVEQMPVIVNYEGSSFLPENNVQKPNQNWASIREDDECRSFGVFIGNKLRNYSKHTRSIVQHAISNVIFNADQGLLNVHS